MDKIRETAMFCVGRAVMFGALAISLVMLSFAFDPPMALKAGGILGLALSVILLWCAQTVHRKKPKETETWLLLTEDSRPSGDHGRQIFVSVMEEVHLFYASRAFIAAVTLLAGGLILSLLGVKSAFL